MSEEFSVYKVLCGELVDVPSTELLDAIVTFWRLNSHLLPCISKFAKYAFTIVTSSASAERAFSVLKSTFDARQVRALEDYVAVSCMLQYNNRVD